MSHPEGAWANLFKGMAALRVAVICYGTGLFATNSMVSYTVMPSAVLELQALPFLSWTTTIAVVAAILGSASGGIAAAALGARIGFLAATLGFQAGAMLSAVAPDITVLLVGRALQGAAGGLIVALCYGTVREFFPPVAWPKVFAMISGMWGLAALVGPLLGGISAQGLSWRWSFAALAVLGVFFVPLIWAGLPAAKTIRHTIYPLGRLVALGSAILMIAAVGNVDSLPGSIFLLVLATVVIPVVLGLDSGKRNKLFPVGSFNPATVIGTGIWMVLTLMMGTIYFSVFGPIVLQQIHGLPPIWAGYFVSLQTASWTVAAIIVANLPDRLSRYCIVAGPLLTAAGMLGVSLFMANGPLLVLGGFVSCSGAGVGLCWAFVGRIILAAAREGENDLTASAIPTAQMGGMALGSAVAGIIANGLGFGDGAGLPVIKTVAVWLPMSFVLPLMLAAVMGVRLATMSRAACLKIRA